MHPPAADGATDSVWHQHPLQAIDRDGLRGHLAEGGISLYYPVPFHLQPCLLHLGRGEGDFPEAERAPREVISLPVFLRLTDAEPREVADAVERSYR